MTSPRGVDRREDRAAPWAGTGTITQGSLCGVPSIDGQCVGVLSHNDRGPTQPRCHGRHTRSSLRPLRAVLTSSPVRPCVAPQGVQEESACPPGRGKAGPGLNAPPAPPTQSCASRRRRLSAASPSRGGHPPAPLGMGSRLQSNRVPLDLTPAAVITSSYRVPLSHLGRR